MKKFINRMRIPAMRIPAKCLILEVIGLLFVENLFFYPLPWSWGTVELSRLLLWGAVLMDLVFRLIGKKETGVVAGMIRILAAYFFFSYQPFWSPALWKVSGVILILGLLATAVALIMKKENAIRVGSLCIAVVILFLSLSAVSNNTPAKRLLAAETAYRSSCYR